MGSVRQLCRKTSKNISFGSNFGRPKISPDGRLLLTSINSTQIQLWTAAGEAIGEPILNVGGTPQFSPDNRRIVTYPAEKSVQIFDVSGREIGKPIATKKFEVSPDGSCAIAYASTVSHSAQIFDMWIGRPKGGMFNGTINELYKPSTRFSPDGHLILKMPSSTVVQLRDQDANLVGEPVLHEGEIGDVCFADDGKLVLTQEGDDAIHIWNASGNSVGEPIDHEIGTVGYTTSQDRCIVVYQATMDRTWPTRAAYDFQGKPLGERIAESVYSIENTKFDALLADKDIVRLDHFDSPVHIIEASTYMTREVELLEQRSVIQSTPISRTTRTIKVDPTGKYVVVAQAGVADVVLAEDQTDTAFSLTPDGSRAVTATGHQVHFWEAESGHEFAVISASGNVVRLRFTPDGFRLILTLEDGSVEAWGSRDAADRQRERDALFAESPAARVYVRELVDEGVPDAALLDSVMADKSLSPFRRSEAFEWAVAHLRNPKQPTTLSVVSINGPATRPTTVSATGSR